MMRHKKGVSLMISCVILISIVIGLSIGVYAWLRDYTNVSPGIECKEGTSIVLENSELSYNLVGETSVLTLTIKNNGYFNVHGFLMQVGDDVAEIPVELLFAIDGGDSRGYFEFVSPYLEPETTAVTEFLTKAYDVKVIQIQPYVRGEKGKRIFCEDNVIKQEI